MALELGDILKVTVMLADINDFEEMNETSATFFGDTPPAKSAFEVPALSKGVGIEIEVVTADQ